jgi:putative nucleotidyltransferase with HDIG domain
MPGSVRNSRLRTGAFVAALSLFGGVFALRAGDPNIGDGVGFLFVLPLAVIAVGFGLRGVASALVGFALVVVWDLVRRHGDVTALGYLNRGVAFLALSAMLVGFVFHRRKLEAGIARHYEGALQERTRELDVALAQALRLLARTAEYRDDDTARHTERVGAIAAKIAAQLGLPAQQIKLLREAAPLHDVGKIAIPDEIVLKPGNLDERERAQMQTHAEIGATLLAKAGASSPVLQMAATIAATHHEWWDGMGYPHGLAGERIPLAGRIVAVADVFDALTHDRPYKPAWPISQGIARIKRAAGTQFDPRVVSAFLATQPAVTSDRDTTAPTGSGYVREPLSSSQPADASLLSEPVVLRAVRPATS